MIVPFLMLGLGTVRMLAGGEHGNHEGTQPKPAAALPHCPVMDDEPIDFASSAPSDEGPVYFCCRDCIPKYQSDPAKYAAKVAAQRKALAARPKVQVSCPVSKDPVDREVFAENGGQKVFFCSKACADKYKAEPGKYAAGLANSYTYQTTCPVMGKEIDPKAFTTTAGGARIYYCCKGCDKKLLAEPAKYLPKMVAQGFHFEAKDLPPAAPKEP
jgi:YHS domain-containing protein